MGDVLSLLGFSEVNTTVEEIVECVFRVIDTPFWDTLLLLCFMHLASQGRIQDFGKGGVRVAVY